MPCCRECFTCDRVHHWVTKSGLGNVLVTTCIDPRCGWSVVD